jgi:DNA polymerase III subunit beta
MKATVNRRNLTAALKTVLPASPRAGGALPVLSGVHIDASDGQLRLTCTNLDLTITTVVEAEVGEPGVVVVPANVTARIIAALTGDTVNLAVDDDQLAVGAGRAATQLRTLDADTWPRITEADGTPATLDADIITGIRRVLHAASDDMNRPILTGVHFTDGIIEATDSYRLAQVATPTNDVIGALIPADAVKAVLADNPDVVTVTVNQRSATFTDGITTWTTRLIEGEFPNTGALLRSATNPLRITADATELADAVNTVAALGNSDTGPRVRLTLTDGQLLVENTNAGVGHTETFVDAEGDFTDPIEFNPQQLLDLLDAAGDRPVTIELASQMRPVLAHIDNLTLLLMPVKISAGR